MDLESTLLRFAAPLVGTLTGQVTQQMTKLGDQAVNPMQAMVQAVAGSAVSEVWRGDGADAFAEAVGRILIPGVNSIISGGQQLTGGLQHASETIQQADRDVQGQADDLAQIFGSVFNL